MATTLDNLLDQALDIAGTLFQTDSLTIGDESEMLGREISGQTGSSLSITGTAPNMTLTGLTGLTAGSIGKFITVSGAASAGNNGTFLITQYVSATSAVILNTAGVGGDANNGSISWTERSPWSAEDDHNYHRTDRAAIKGVAYDAGIPTYFKCIDQTTPIPANLSNIAGKTTDAKSFITDRKFEDITPVVGSLFLTLTDIGQLKHADSTDVTGVPIYDGFDAGDDEATYAELIADGYGAGLVVLSGVNAGNRIFGRTRAGSSTSPNSVEIEFRSVAIGQSLSSSIAYAWEAEQSSNIDVYYPYRDCLDSMSENAFRTLLVNGLVADAGLNQKIENILNIIGVDGYGSDLSGQLTNLTQYYPFYNLPDATPTVVDALNVLNEQIGIRDYTGIILTDGETLTESLQALSDAIANSSAVTRTIERVSADIPAGTTHTLPGSISYLVDVSGNGNGLWVYWRGVLRDPGPISAGNDYEETATTSITVYSNIKSGDHINYFVAL